MFELVDENDNDFTEATPTALEFLYVEMNRILPETGGFDIDAANETDASNGHELLQHIGILRFEEMSLSAEALGLNYVPEYALLRDALDWGQRNNFAATADWLHVVHWHFAETGCWFLDVTADQYYSNGDGENWTEEIFEELSVAWSQPGARELSETIRNAIARLEAMTVAEAAAAVDDLLAAYAAFMGETHEPLTTAG